MTRKQARLRDASVIRQSGRCHYCGLQMCTGDPQVFAQRNGLSLKASRILTATAEHLIPRSEGVKTTAGNVVAAHRHCNETRHRPTRALSHADYLVRVQARVSSKRWLTAKLLESRDS